MSDSVNIKIIGLGGIGSYLCDPLFRYLNSKNQDVNICLIDGDVYEIKNLDRQNFSVVDRPKAEQKKDELASRFTNCQLDSINGFINEFNVRNLIHENDFVFLCVDNHKTRNIVNERVNELDHCVLISGGNDYTDGNVQIFIKRDGHKITPSLTDYHPEILNYTDQTPEEMSCEELHNVEPQLIFSNLFASTIMVSAFYNIFENQKTEISEIYFDIEVLNSLSKTRKVK